MEDISPAELFLLNCLYEIGEGDFSKILDRVNSKTGVDKRDWKKSTVLTLLRRLVDKGYVTRIKGERYFIYSPKLTWTDTIELALQRLFGSTHKSILFSYLLKTSSLKKKDEEWLKQMADSLEREKRDS